MASTDNKGIKKLNNGCYSCRIYKTIDGVVYDKCYRKDAETGEPFRTKREARDYRDKIIGQLLEHRFTDKRDSSVKFKEVWDCFLKHETSTRAHGTVVKHTSVWKNHIKDAFGNKYISGAKAVKISDIEKYLTTEYHTTSYSYGYILSYAKVFYFLYSIAYKHKMIDRETYNTYIVDKSTRIKMPKKKEEEREKENEIETYNQKEIDEMYKVFNNTDLEGAFLIAYLCGLRESEVFGLTWDNIDFKKNTIKVEKQLLKENGVWCFDRLKTARAYRTIEMPSALSSYLQDRQEKMNQAWSRQSFRGKANEIIVDVRSEPSREIVGADLVNRKLLDGLDGKMLSVNSVKYYSKRIKELYGYPFKMHKLRKTHFTQLAAKGYPPKAIMARAGHSKLETAMMYYISDKDDTIQQQKIEILNSIPIKADDPIIELKTVNPLTGEPMTIKVRKSALEQQAKTA